MTPYQETRVREMLDMMAADLISPDKLNSSEDASFLIGRLQYTVWELRQILGMPAIAGLDPLNAP